MFQAIVKQLQVQAMHLTYNLFHRLKVLI